MVYRIGVQRIGPFYKRYTVTGHEMDVHAGLPRLVLYCQDGSIVFVPRLDRKRVKIYPDYKAQKARLEAYKADVEAKASALLRTTAPLVEG